MAERVEEPQPMIRRRRVGDRREAGKVEFA